MLLLVRNSFNKNTYRALLIQNLCKEFEVKVYIKKKEKIKRVIIATINNIINKIRNANIETTFFNTQNIIIIKKQFDIVIFKIKTKKNKRILKKKLNKEYIVECEFTQSQL